VNPIVLLAVLAQSMTDIQIIGSHNSYHAGLAPSEMQLLRKANPKAGASLDYTHPPLLDQLNLGVRKFELDIFSDAKGGLFANPQAPKLVAKEGLPADPPFDPTGKMNKPGFKVIHVQDYDYRSTCQPLVECLTILRDWSKAHENHLPIYVMLETKTGKNIEAMTTASLDALDAEILGVFDKRHLITPDVVRGKAKTLEQAVLTKGWPKLKQARGKIIFLFDQENVTPFYTQGRPNLEGRVVFTNGKPGTPDAAFLKMNNPYSPDIPEMVRKGYLVRTRADADGRETKDAALASGAQIISTDYYFSKKMANGYSVDFGSGIARCNPVKANGCKAKDLTE
jgi:hypothetical protein